MPDSTQAPELVDGLPINYPFDTANPPSRYTEPGPLHGAHALVFDTARHYRWDGLEADDFQPGPMTGMTMHEELAELRTAVMALASAWNGLGAEDLLDLDADADAVCWQAADLEAVLSTVLTPAMCVEEALVNAVRAARRRTKPARAARDDEWTEFDDEAQGLIRTARGEHLPYEQRHAAITQLIAQARLQRARLVLQHQQQVAHHQDEEGIDRDHC